MFCFNAIDKGSPKFCSRMIALLACWGIGLFFGIFISHSIGDFLFSLMREAIKQPVSIVGLLVSVILPLFLTIVSIATNRQDLIAFVCLYKSISYGFCVAMVFDLYGTSAWLVWLLFLFTDSVCLLTMFSLWLSATKYTRTTFLMREYCCLMVCILAAGIDYYIISPLLQELF